MCCCYCCCWWWWCRLFVCVHVCVQGRGIQKEDVRALLDYLCSVPNVSHLSLISFFLTEINHFCHSFAALHCVQEDNLRDVLDLMLALVFEDSHHPGNTVSMFYHEGGIKLVRPIVILTCCCHCYCFCVPSIAAKLLACKSEELTLNALKLIGVVLHHLPQE